MKNQNGPAMKFWHYGGGKWALRTPKKEHDEPAHWQRTMLAYYARKNSENEIPYSPWSHYPATSSDSASLPTNGVRWVSARRHRRQCGKKTAAVARNSA